MARLGSFPIGDTGEQFITLDWTPDPHVVEAEMLEVAIKLEDWSIPLAAARAAAIYDTDLHFETESDPDGNPWEALNFEYANSKRKQESAHPGQILQLTGALHGAATAMSTWFIRGNSLFFDVGALPSYGPYHQEGSMGKKNAANAIMDKGTGAFTASEINIMAESQRGGALPQRMFIGLDEDTIAEIEAIFVDYFDSTVKTTSGARGFETNIVSGGGRVVRGAGGRFVGRSSG